MIASKVIAERLGHESTRLTDDPYSQIGGGWHVCKRLQMIMRNALLMATCSSVVWSFVGCAAEPDTIITIKSPTAGFFYSVETYRGVGAPTSDDTRVYAHLQRNGKATKRLVLDGDLSVARITWNGPYEATICIDDDSITETFRDEVTLSLDDYNSENIRTHLEDNCKWSRNNIGG